MSLKKRVKAKLKFPLAQQAAEIFPLNMYQTPFVQ